MRVDGTAAFHPLSIPYLKHYLFTRDDSLRLTRKEIKEIEFLAGHIDKLVIEVYFTGVEVDAQWST